MEQFDPAMAQRVWQRVAQPMQEMPTASCLLLSYAQEQAAVYRQLMQSATSKQRELLRQLYDGTMMQVHTLRGLQRLSSGTLPKMKPLTVPREPLARALEKAYHRTVRTLAEYTALSAQADHGSVYREMAQRESRHTALIAQLLGMAENNP